MKTLTSTLTTTVVNSDDGLHCYEVTRTLENVEGKKAILLTLYPSFSGQDIHKLDATAMHLMNHLMYDLGISSVKIINLFSKVVKGTKPSSRRLVVDEDNMNYIEELMKAKDFESYMFIVAYGSSMSTCLAANVTKKRVLDMFHSYHPNGKTYQLTCDDQSIAGNDAVHPLFLGIRASNLKWKLVPYNPPATFGKSENKEPMKNQEKKISIRKKLALVEESTKEDVSETE